MSTAYYTSFQHQHLVIHGFKPSPFKILLVVISLEILNSTKKPVQKKINFNQIWIWTPDAEKYKVQEMTGRLKDTMKEAVLTEISNLALFQL